MRPYSRGGAKEGEVCPHLEFVTKLQRKLNLPRSQAYMAIYRALKLLEVGKIP